MGFVMHPDAVCPDRVPSKTLYTGARIPVVGLGTFGSDRFSNADIAAAVYDAIHCGYRFIDCAACYGNEKEIGEVFHKIFVEEGLPREEVFIMSKLWNDKHAPADVVASCRKTLEDLQLEYLDCYLVHWPFPNYHAPGVSVDARSADARPYIHEEFMATWRAMEQLVEAGLVRHIGTSNVTIPKLSMILRDAKIQPAVNEMELHPCFQQGELFQYCLDHDVQPIGFCPVGSPNRPERDKTPEDLADTEQPVVMRIAAAHGVHPAVVCVKWAAQRGQIPIPFSIHHKNYVSNLWAVTEDPLTVQEMEDMRSVERNCRLIKGQVFLWEGAKGWLDLWDADGTIPGWNSYEA